MYGVDMTLKVKKVTCLKQIVLIIKVYMSDNMDMCQTDMEFGQKYLKDKINKR